MKANERHHHKGDHHPHHEHVHHHWSKQEQKGMKLVNETTVTLKKARKAFVALIDSLNDAIRKCKEANGNGDGHNIDKDLKVEQYQAFKSFVLHIGFQLLNVIDDDNNDQTVGASKHQSNRA